MKKIILMLFLFFSFTFKVRAFFVKDFYGQQKEYFLDENTENRVLHLKQQLKLDFKVDVSNQHLYLDGVLLKNNQRLKYYGINKESVIYLINKKDNYNYPIEVIKQGLGTVLVSKKAQVGTNVFIDIYPLEDTLITVYDFAGNKIKLEDNRFIMPFGPVKINVVFKTDTKNVMSFSYSNKNFIVPFLIFLISSLLSLILKN